VPDQVKPSFVIFDIWHSDAQSTHMATVAVKGLNRQTLKVHVAALVSNVLTFAFDVLSFDECRSIVC